jgi:GTP pyrophosphokinase
LAWARDLVASSSDADSEAFLTSVKHDLYDDRVLVYTPKGDIKNFPAGATPVDFAYSIHSQVGNRMFGAKVNGRIVPLSYALQTGDRVDIMTGGNTRGPSRDWLKIAKTGEARGKILQWFKRERRDENIENGRNDFERELTRQGLARGAVMQVGIIGPLLEKMHYATIDDLFAAIGYGGMTANRAVLRMKDELRRQMKLEEKEEEPIKIVKPAKPPKRAKSGVVVEGAGDCLVKFAKCCGPVPGDPIVAFTTRGAGFAVHRDDCSNALRDQAAQPDRFAAVRWMESDNLPMTTPIQVLGKNRANLLHDVSEALKTVPIRQFNGRELDKGIILFSALIEVESLVQLTGLLNRLRGVSGVTEIFRGNEKGKKP